MSLAHVDALKAAAADGELWKLRVTSVPDPDDTRGYVERALAMREQGNRLPFVVVDLENDDRIIGSTSYHDIVPAIDRLEIGWTWYARSTQRSHVNTCAKLLLLVHAFETLARSWWAGAPTTTTSRARRPSSGSARRRTACCATTRCGATARCATP
jgi:RimJ/RimL family protein N-acetyltransferase